MYRPLAGYRDKKEERMSVDPAGPVSSGHQVNPLSQINQASKEAQGVQTENQQGSKSQDLSDQQKSAVVTNFYDSKSMSTEDFMVLRGQSEEEPFKLLDLAIQKMKENNEITAELFDEIIEAVKESTKQNVALQVLQKTLEGLSSNEE